MVEHLLAKEKAAGSNPVFRSIHFWVSYVVARGDELMSGWDYVFCGIIPSAASAAISRCCGVNDSFCAIHSR